MISIGRNSNLAGKIIRGSEGNDPKRDVVAIEAIYDFVESPIAAAGYDDVHPAASGIRSERGRGAAFESRMGFDEMAFGADPIHEVTNIFTVGSSAVNDQYDVLGWHIGA